MVLRMAERRTMANGGRMPLGGSDLPLGSIGSLIARVFGTASIAYLFIWIVHLFIIGYSYANTYYERFGLQLHEIDVGYLETIEFSAHLSRDFQVISLGIISAIFFVIIYGYYFVSSVHRASSDLSTDRFTSKERWNLFLALALVLALFGFGYSSIFIGHQLGNEYATRIVKGIDGRTAYCELKEYKFPNEEFKEKFKKATNGGRVIKIKETKKMMYLFIPPKPEKLEESDHGDSYVFHKSDISHCRVAGARS